MNTQSVNTSFYQKGDISLERIYGKYRNSFIRYAGKVLSDEFYAEAAALKYIYAAYIIVVLIWYVIGK